MKEIKLYNRDGGDLRLVKLNEENWKLEVDKEHDYVLKYMRIIGKEFASNMNPENWEAIDPAGGPFLSIGDILENKYEIIGFVNETTLIINERNNN